ncbi:2,3-diaminopropionate biosynthesis protein SbnB [Herbidospora galbida]|uniref:2,3-diaminopropionate biosynthesis protein SbnB n=1 Tax=Herbidospora galbida TaxID=2575442 RepID=A0A4U3MDE7_9ACTN|nr:2,3-diaminopropionate biosynthesis protein SbnB [Herbidospora galbida]TKK87205.1 2,3-diaminopropionate biosynthesis protein SbnB [Herbidospora galbida]
MLILGKGDVLAVLDGAEDRVVQTVSDAYAAHAREQTSVPHAVFLRFPGSPRDRIIALPAYVGGERPVAAVKWIASFPGNIDRGIERASAAIIVNSVDDGRPVALVEGSVISARRTAASAALAARLLTTGAPDGVRAGVSLIGCGVINFEILRFLRALLPVESVTVHDTDPGRADRFVSRLTGLKTTIAAGADEALAANRIVSVATTAATPHLSTGPCRPGTVVLHVSLRDLDVPSILGARNVVDDTGHVCRAATSLDLAQQATGGREFVHHEIGDLIIGRAATAHDPDGVTVFSPFGLGALDAALAAHVLDVAEARGLGVRAPGFLD